jgi:hypothetical protein
MLGGPRQGGLDPIVYSRPFALQKTMSGFDGISQSDGGSIQRAIRLERIVFTDQNRWCSEWRFIARRN